ncbi:MAG: S24 family peptidase [Proteobacteria bacterium]|nr:MAG: S24 family peptidase [Pseudomonadota bacterium]
MVDIKASAGSGGFAGNARTRMDLAFISGWLKRQGLQPQNLKLIEVLGDSMEPRIYEGDMVLIDTAQNTPRTGGVYAVMTDGWLKIKRLYVTLTGEIELHSDNEKYRPERPDSSLTIVGRCVWTAGSGGL